jgi:hypothetical protein
MQVRANLPLVGRDLRLDLFRGLANWAIFLDHIPHEVMSSITTRNYGFSDAADLFVFISGYAAACVFGRIMVEQGCVAAASRLVKRAFCSNLRWHYRNTVFDGKRILWVMVQMARPPTCLQNICGRC